MLGIFRRRSRWRISRLNLKLSTTHKGNLWLLWLLWLVRPLLRDQAIATHQLLQAVATHQLSDNLAHQLLHKRAQQGLMIQTLQQRICFLLFTFAFGGCISAWPWTQGFANLCSHQEIVAKNIPNGQLTPSMCKHTRNARIPWRIFRTETPGP